MREDPVQSEMAIEGKMRRREVRMRTRIGT
jgi:hypothetical protein